MSKVEQMKPPKRYLVETETDDEGNEIATVVDATGELDPVYIQGHHSPWLGLPLEEIERHAREKAYGAESGAVLVQCRLIREKGGA